MTWDRFKSLYYTNMASLEAGAIANPDEKRMVGHYWLRAPELAPTEELRTAITATLEAMKSFVTKVHKGGLTAPGGAKFKEVLVIGIGGSALGPQFVSHALGRLKGNRDKMGVSFFDNTDPDGIDRVLARLGSRLAHDAGDRHLQVRRHQAETRNGMLEAKVAYERAGLDYPKHASPSPARAAKLDQVAIKEGWLARFPMWDWVGGRTSELSAVGLLPAALQGINVDQLLPGAAAMDEATRKPDPPRQPRRGCWRSPGIGPPTARATRTWWCCPTRTACCSSRATCSSSSWSRSARSTTSRARS
jgi:glucose-6-phosphate isomerase